MAVEAPSQGGRRCQSLRAGPLLPLGLRGVSLSRWQADCETRCLSTAKTEKGRDRVFRKTAADLRDAGRIAMRDRLVWLAREDQADG
jgi:hypothetical protein